MCARLPERIPEGKTVFGRAVQFPAQLTHIGHAKGQAGHGSNGNPLGRHVGERLIRQVGIAEGLNDVARARTPDAEARPGGGHVLDVHRAIVRLMLAHPAEVVVAKGGPGDDEEALVVEAGHREIALDPTAPVQHLRVGDAPWRAIHVVVAQALKKGQRARSGHLDLGERGLIEEPGSLPGRPMLRRDGR